MKFRMPFTTIDAYKRGYTKDSLSREVARGKVQRIDRGVFVEGEQKPTTLELAVATVVITGGVASATLSGWLYKLDSVHLEGPYAIVPADVKRFRSNVRRINGVESAGLIKGVPLISGLDVLIELAAIYDDDRWERVLENALRDKLTTIEEIEAALPGLSKKRAPGLKVIKRVLKRRPIGAPPTESILETMMVQLLRKYGLPDPERQVNVYTTDGRWLARVDLYYPGVFVELDCQGHKGQPVYDSLRETSVVAETGWHPTRITWTEVTQHPQHTANRMRQILEMRARAA